MELSKIITNITNHIKQDNMYNNALNIIDIDELESYFYDCDVDFLNLLDEAISVELKRISIPDLISKLEENLKFQLAKHYIEEYDDEDDLNNSFAYYYIMYEFMLNLTDSILLEAYSDMVLIAKDIKKDVRNPLLMDIINVLKKNSFKLPVEDSIEFNKGYLLSYIHTKCSYEEQFYLLNEFKNYTNKDWVELFSKIKNSNIKIRNTNWFIY